MSEFKLCAECRTQIKCASQRKCDMPVFSGASRDDIAARERALSGGFGEAPKWHYHRGGVSAEKCPLCRDAERLSWLNLNWEQIEYGGGDLAKLRELIDAAMAKENATDATTDRNVTP